MCLSHSQPITGTHIILYTGSRDETVYIVNTIQKHPGHKTVTAKTKKNIVIKNLNSMQQEALATLLASYLFQPGLFSS